MKSEDFKNWVTAAAIIIGGIWAFFEWNTLLPKTEAEILKEVAELRTRTTGNLEVTIFGLPDGVEPQMQNGQTWSDICGRENPPTSIYVRLPVRAQLSLRSSSPLPARVEVAEFLVSELSQQNVELSIVPNFPFNARHSWDMQNIEIPEGGFLGGLNWTIVEPNEQSNIAVFGFLNLPFECSPSSWVQTEVALGLRVKLTGVLSDPEIQQQPISRYFLQTCVVNPSGTSTCDAPQGGEGNHRSNLKAIAQ